MNAVDESALGYERGEAGARFVAHPVNARPAAPAPVLRSHSRRVSTGDLDNGADYSDRGSDPGLTLV